MGDIYAFHISVHARPPDAEAGPPIDLGGPTVSPLNVGAEAFTDPLGATFDEAVETLQSLPRLFLELDGSFLWTAPQGPKIWQIEGVLYDRGDRLHYVELKGNCPPPQFDAVLSALGWPDTPLAFQLLRQAVFLGEKEFRRFAQTA